MPFLKLVFILLLFTCSNPLFTQDNCVFFPVIQHADVINKIQIDSIQIIRVEQEVKLEIAGTPAWISLRTISPITAFEIDSTLNRIKKEWHSDSAVFINEEERWRTIKSSENDALIDSTLYIKFTPKSCWGGAYPVMHKNKIKRNKLNLVTRVKSAEFICDYTYDSNNHIITVEIKYRRGVQVYEGSIGQAEFMYDASGRISAIKTKDYFSGTELDYFTIVYH